MLVAGGIPLSASAAVLGAGYQAKQIQRGPAPRS